MVILDCESIDSTYASIQSIFSLSRDAIDNVFASLNFERFYSENRNYRHDAQHLLLETIKGKSSSAIRVDAVSWFHLSRVPSPDSFHNGILPLGEQITKIWDLLRIIAGTRISDSDWAEFYKEMGDSTDQRFIAIVNLSFANQQGSCPSRQHTIGTQDKMTSSDDDL